MSSVVFLKAVNVGGPQKFQPTALARDLARLGIVNLGAAGTFVVRETIGPKDLRAEILRCLPFEPEMMICSGNEIQALAVDDSFIPKGSAEGVKPFVTVLEKAPRNVPKLPRQWPAGEKWEVRLTQVRGRFALGVWRRLGKAILYPNAVLEKEFGLAATTRGWNTIARLATLL